MRSWLSLLLLLLPSLRPAQDWSSVWADLWRLESLGEGAEADRLREELGRLMEGAEDRGRAAILRAHLFPQAGPLEAAELPADLDPQSAGWAAPVMEAGLARAETYALALEDPSQEAYARVVGPAFQAFVADVDAMRVEAAEVLGVALHERAQATWSAGSLALWSTRMGKDERSRRVLDERLASPDLGPDERRELLERRAISALGAGDIVQARRDLGATMAMGATNPVQILARLALAEGERRRSSRLFGSLLVPRADEDPLATSPWALRGWGLSLLAPEP